MKLDEPALIGISIDGAPAVDALGDNSRTAGSELTRWTVAPPTGTAAPSEPDAFVAARGRGAFFTYTRAPGLSGHNLLAEPALWSADLAAFMRQSVP